MSSTQRVAGYTIYVRDADIESGTWKNIFIYTEDAKTGETRLITSTNGRIDSTGEFSELVLENAAANTFSTAEGKTKYVSESIGEVRFSIRTRRGELINRLGSAELTPEELGLSQLSDYAQAKTGPERTEAELLWQRRILLSITPLIFCLLGASMMLTLRRRGRGFAIVVSLACLVVYYLLTFLGEQLARTGRASVLVAALLPIGASAVAIAGFYATSRLRLAFDPLSRLGEWFARLDLHPRRIQTRNIFVDVTTGLRDLDLAWTLVKYYVLTVVFLAAVFVIFTAFELWRFAGAMEGGTLLLGRYLVYLMPFVYIQIAPSAAMIATLATYVIKSRRNEIVSWTAAGQSVYRLLLPCFVLTILLGAFNWIVQEYLMPSANRVQDAVRTQIRSRGLPQNQSGKLWIARDHRIFSFRFDTAASDNDVQIVSCVTGCAFRDLTIYEFAADNARLQAVYHIPRAVWARDELVSAEGAQRVDLSAGNAESRSLTEDEVGRLPDPFVGIRRKPSLLSARELKGRIAAAASPVERRSLEVALEKKYVTIFLPFIIALFTAPFALSLRGKGKAATVGYAVGLWLLFVGTTNFFEQFGLNGSLPPAFAIWGPMTIFAMIGVYLLARVRS